jgi:hypothetical protein
LSDTNRLLAVGKASRFAPGWNANRILSTSTEVKNAPGERS